MKIDRRRPPARPTPRPPVEKRPTPKRRALSNLGGEIELEGAPDDAEGLSRALYVDSAPAPRPDRAARAPQEDLARDDPDREHVHGFHTFSARMHPATARRLVERFAPARGVVLDPFCGSGTVLVETMLAGRDAVGTDLNPLAVELAWLKVRPRSAESIAHLPAAARSIAAHADARRKARAGATRRYPDEDVAAFEPHVLLELDSLRAAIAAEHDVALRRDLALVLSAILVKLSRRRGDTSEITETRRIGAGYPAKLFSRKAEELSARLTAFRGYLPSATPRARVAVDDATQLGSLVGVRADAVVTSPPYAATYDYVAHHALRLRWLGWDARAFEDNELGARRRYANLTPRDAHLAWRDELRRFLDALAPVVRRGAPVVLLLADSAVRGAALRADDAVADVARAGRAFEPRARASQPRPHFHAPTLRAFEGAPRREHALLLVRR